MTDRQLDDWLNDLQDDLSVTPSRGFEASLRRRVAAASMARRRTAAIVAVASAGVVVAVLAGFGGMGEIVTAPAFSGVADTAPPAGPARSYATRDGAEWAIVGPNRSTVPRSESPALYRNGAPPPVDSSPAGGGVVWPRDVSMEPVPVWTTVIELASWPTGDKTIRIPAIELSTAVESPSIEIPRIPIPGVERPVVQSAPPLAAGGEKQQ